MPEINRPCPACTVGLHEECENPTDLGDGWIKPCYLLFVGGPETLAVKVSRDSGIKDPTEVGDILSTGRKRAAMLLPVLEGQVCDWAGLKWAGGGAHPIVGCTGTKLSPVKKNDDLPSQDGSWSRVDRHHGPDKNVLNNAVGRNLHAICTVCHRRWHELNDPTFGEGRPDAHVQWVPAEPYYAHDPVTRATPEDVEASEAYWSEPAGKRGEFRVEKPAEERLIFPEDSSILNVSDNPFEEPLDPFTENGDTE